MTKDADDRATAEPWLARPIGYLTAWLLRSPKSVLVVALLLAVAAVAFAAMKLGFRGSRLDLLDPDSTYNRRWIAYLDEFGKDDDVLVVVEGSDAAQVVPVMDEIVTALEQDPEAFTSILYRTDLTKLRSKALHFLSSQQLRELERFCIDSESIVQGDWNSLSVLSVAQRLAAVNQAESVSSVTARRSPSGAESMEDPRHRQWLQLYVAGLRQSLVTDEVGDSPWTGTLKMLRELSERFEPKYLLYDEGRLGMVLLRLGQAPSRFQGPDVQPLSALVREVQSRHPEVAVGITGMPVLESDEMLSSQTDTANASLISLAGVACVFIVGFGGIRRPLFSLTALLVALAWSMGYITISVGHLNILSASFGAILIGLGVDFSIHYLAQYANCRKRSRDRREALIDTARSVGPGIVTGGVTTSLAFSTAAFTRFMGVAELGLIVAGGILLCILAAIVVLPALIACWDSRHPQWREPTDVARLVHRINRHAWAMLLLGVAASAFVAFGLQRVTYDHNLLNLQPDKLQSVALERRLSDRLNRGVWHALSVSPDRQQLLDRKAQFELLPEVSRTEEIASLIPIVSVVQRTLVAGIHQRLQQLPQRPPELPVGPHEQVKAAVEQLSRVLREDGTTAGAPFSHLTDAEFHERVRAYQRRVANDVLTALRQVSLLSNPAVPAQADLPASLRSRFISRTGYHLLRVYGHGDIWDMEPLERFVRDVESVDPAATGHPIQTYYASREMQRSFFDAAVYSLLAVSIVLMLDFRKIRFCLLAMFPMAMGMLLLFGTLGWLEISLNPANMIVLPLILGIGIDDGVHVVHDYLRQPRGSYRISNSTASAVLLTSLTTMIGFGSMMLASHRGLRSLGQVLTIGIFCCLLTSLLLLPPLLGWIGGLFSADE